MQARDRQGTPGSTDPVLTAASYLLIIAAPAVGTAIHRKGQGHMSNVAIPGSLSVAGWEKLKTAFVAKDKKAADELKSQSGKMSEALNKVLKAHSDIDFGALDPKSATSPAAAERALAKIESERSSLKTLIDAANAASSAADAFAKAAGPVRKGLKGDAEKALGAAVAAATSGSGAVDKFIAELKAAFDEGEKEMKEAAKPKAGAKAAAPNPKAASDGKAIGALIKKMVAALRSGKPMPQPVKFLAVRLEKKVRIYLGPKPDSALAKLKTQFEPKAKIKLIKDPKGSVLWEKGALTFVTDKLSTVGAKLLQQAIKEQTKGLNAKVRIKKSDGKVDEADAAELKDSDLQVDADDEAALKVDMKDVMSRLAEMKAEIEAAIKKGGDAKLKTLYASLQSHIGGKKADDASDALDEIEALLEPADEDEGDEAESSGDKGVPPATAFLAKFNALRSKIDAAVAAGGATAKQIGDLSTIAQMLAKKGDQASVDKADEALSRIEQMLGAATTASVGGLSVAKLATARLEWIGTRDTAITEITFLSKAIVAAFAKEPSQASQLKAAITKLAGLTLRLKTTLDNELDAALTENDPTRRAQLAAKAKGTLASIRKFVEEDELMSNLDDNEVRKMSVVGPMKKSLAAISAALGQ